MFISIVFYSIFTIFLVSAFLFLIYWILDNFAHRIFYFTCCTVVFKIERIYVVCQWMIIFCCIWANSESSGIGFAFVCVCVCIEFHVAASKKNRNFQWKSIKFVWTLWSHVIDHIITSKKSECSTHHLRLTISRPIWYYHYRSSVDISISQKTF